jgi:hypothetical protein
MDEFKRQGGNLTGREERTDAFGGEPRAVGGTLGGAGAKGTTSLTENDTARNGHHNKEHLGTTGTAGTTGSHTASHDNSGKKPSLMDKMNPKIDADGDGKAGFMK